MENLDPKSKAFIERTLEKLRNETEFKLLVGKVMSQTFNYYMDTPKELLIRHCKDKMIAGAKEHGKPKTKPLDILKELRMEDLDKLLWYCMLEEAETDT